MDEKDETEDVPELSDLWNGPKDAPAEAEAKWRRRVVGLVEVEADTTPDAEVGELSLFVGSEDPMVQVVVRRGSDREVVLRLLKRLQDQLTEDWPEMML